MGGEGRGGVAVVVVGRGGREEGTTWFKKGKMDRDLVFNLLYTILFHKNTYTKVGNDHL